MKPVNTENILHIVEQVIKILSENNIHYLIYGSLAYYLYIHENIEINDVDIMVSQNDLIRIKEITDELPMKIYESEYAVHANHLSLLGNNGKPFDVSFDSWDRYFKGYDIDINSFSLMTIGNTSAQVVSLEQLVKIYEISIDKNNYDKLGEYERKLDNLNELMTSSQVRK